MPLCSSDEDLAVDPAGARLEDGQHDRAVVEPDLHALLHGLRQLLEARRELLGRAGHVDDVDARARALLEVDGLAVAQAADAQARALQVHDDGAGAAAAARERADHADVPRELSVRRVRAVQAERVDARGEQVEHHRGLGRDGPERGEDLRELGAGRRRLVFVGGH
jgi:hypothetical protein